MRKHLQQQDKVDKVDKVAVYQQDKAEQELLCLSGIWQSMCLGCNDVREKTAGRLYKTLYVSPELAAK